MRAALIVAGASLRSRRRVGLAATWLVLVLAALGISAGLAVARQGAPVLDEAADAADVAHLVVYGAPGDLEQVAADPDVVASSGPFPTLGDVELVDGDEVVPIEMTALDDPGVPVNRPPIIEGRWARDPDEIVLDRSLAADMGLVPGDVASFRYVTAVTDFTVVGTAVSFTDCFYPMCDPGRVWVTGAGFDRAAGAAGTHAVAQVWLRFDRADRADAFVGRMGASGLAGITGTNSWLDTRDDFLALDRIFGAFVSVFGLFVLVCAAVVVAGSTAMRIVTRRREIGLLGAVGCTPRQIATGLVVENLAIGIVACVVGWAIAGFAVPSLQIGIAATLGPQDPTWKLTGLLAALLVVSVVLTSATLVPAVRAARRPVTDVLRDVPRGHVSWMNRLAAGVPTRLPLLGAQEAGSQPTRSVLAALAVMVAVIGTVASLGFIGAINAVAQDPARQGDPWDIALVRGDVPAADIETALTGATGVANWFSDVERRSTLDAGAFLSVATGGSLAGAGYHIIDGRTVTAPGEAIAGYGWLRRFDREIGDEVDILAGSAAISLRVVGSYRETEDSGEILRYGLDDLTAVEPGVSPDVYRVALLDGYEGGDVADALADRLGAGVRVEVVDTGIDDMQPMFFALRLIASILVLMAATNLVSTLLTSNREASNRIGVQLAVGFTPRQLVAHGAVAGASIGVAAGLVGLPAGLWVFRLLSDVVSSGIGVGPGWMPLPPVLPLAALGIGTVVFTACIGAFAVARVAARPASDLIRTE